MLEIIVLCERIKYASFCMRNFFSDTDGLEISCCGDSSSFKCGKCIWYLRQVTNHSKLGTTLKRLDRKKNYIKSHLNWNLPTNA